jgi:hypothetical protein
LQAYRYDTHLFESKFNLPAISTNYGAFQIRHEKVLNNGLLGFQADLPHDVDCLVLHDEVWWVYDVGELFVTVFGSDSVEIIINLT